MVLIFCFCCNGLGFVGWGGVVVEGLGLKGWGFGRGRWGKQKSIYPCQGARDFCSQNHQLRNEVKPEFLLGKAGIEGGPRAGTSGWS